MRKNIQLMLILAAIGGIFIWLAAVNFQKAQAQLGSEPSIAKQVDKASASDGDILTYTLTYSNPTTNTYTNAKIEDPIPSGTTYVEGSATAGATFDGSKISLNIGDLAPGASGTVSFQVGIGQKQSAQVPTGIYVMISNTRNKTDINQALDKSFVDGGLITDRWEDIQPQNATDFDWSTIDNNLALVKPKNKKASLVVFAGKFTPQWVYDQGVRQWTTSDGDIYPDPTDTKFYDLWLNFVQAFGQKYGQDDSITQVSMCGGTGALCGLRFSELPSDWNAATVISQWQRVVAAFTTAFPTTKLTYEIQGTKGESTNLADQMMTDNFTKFGTRIGTFEDFLGRKDPSNPIAPTEALADIILKWGPKGGKTWCAFQMTSMQKTDLDAALSHGYNDFGCKYFEVYIDDLLNPNLESTNQSWHDQIWTNP